MARTVSSSGTGHDAPAWTTDAVARRGDGLYRFAGEGMAHVADLLPGFDLRPALMFIHKSEAAFARGHDHGVPFNERHFVEVALERAVNHVEVAHGVEHSGAHTAEVLLAVVTEAGSAADVGGHNDFTRLLRLRRP